MFFSAFVFLSVGPVHYSWDPQVVLFNKIFIKTGSHSTIHIFKNYFVTVFSVFSNKQYPNRPLVLVWIALKTFFHAFASLSVSPVYYSWDPQVV